jgi:glycosyltransferase involved in cell wall biosynthesis
MHKLKILICSTQYPYYGGAATNAYAIYKHSVSKGLNACALFIGKHPPDTQYDPENIGRVFHLVNETGVQSNFIRSAISSKLGGEPDIILAKNYVAPVVARLLFPQAKIIYLVSGSPVLTVMANEGISAKRFLKSNKFRIVQNDAEIKCIAAADYIVPNSPLTMALFRHIYGPEKVAEVPADTSSFLMNDPTLSQQLSEWQNRVYDIGFICSRMDRKIKNPEFALRLFASDKLNSTRRIAVGQGSVLFSKHATCMELLPNHSLRAILDQTKTIICPSLFDSSPNILREAIASGCNVVLSENCGWSEKYDSAAVCEDVYDISYWEEAILKSLEAPQVPPDFGRFDIDTMLLSFLKATS